MIPIKGWTKCKLSKWHPARPKSKYRNKVISNLQDSDETNISIYICYPRKHKSPSTKGIGLIVINWSSLSFHPNLNKVCGKNYVQTSDKSSFDLVQRERTREAQREIFSDTQDLTTDDEARLPGLHKNTEDKIPKKKVVIIWLPSLHSFSRSFFANFIHHKTLLFGSKNNGASKG